MDSKNLDQKRLDAMLRITQNVIGTGLAGAVPMPAMETAKMIGIAASDAWMFWDVYRIYFNDELTSDKLSEMLNKAGMIIITGGIVSYATLRISQGILGGVLTFIPIGGWLLSGALTGSSSLIAGIFWTGLVESFYLSEQKESV
ncbi:MAG TPA: hypothetical protein PLZ51_23935 [Aggregatilineales bacterium]|nr:hypothetical protein [Aggregatilineales bacterium]